MKGVFMQLRVALVSTACVLAFIPAYGVMSPAQAEPALPAQSPTPALTSSDNMSCAGTLAQECYNQAQAAFDTQDWPKAVRLFSLVIAQARNPNSKALLEIRIRYAQALSENGQYDAAASAFEAILAVGQAQGASDSEASVQIRQMLAKVYMQSFAYSQAAAQFKHLHTALQPAWPQLDNMFKVQFLLDYATSLFWSDGENQAKYSNAIAQLDQAAVLIQMHATSASSWHILQRSRHVLQQCRVIWLLPNHFRTKRLGLLAALQTKHR
jgi:tetratricopeptide (TPR) repeat protein